MAYFPGSAMGLTVPGRPTTPCNGRPQVRPLDAGISHEAQTFYQNYRRPGDPVKQMTRVFANGTFLMFGPEVRDLETSSPCIDGTDLPLGLGQHF